MDFDRVVDGPIQTIGWNPAGTSALKPLDWLTSGAIKNTPIQSCTIRNHGIEVHWCPRASVDLLELIHAKSNARTGPVCGWWKSEVYIVDKPVIAAGSRATKLFKTNLGGRMEGCGRQCPEVGLWSATCGGTRPCVYVNPVSRGGLVFEFQIFSAVCFLPTARRALTDPHMDWDRVEATKVYRWRRCMLRSGTGLGLNRISSGAVFATVWSVESDIGRCGDGPTLQSGVEIPKRPTTVCSEHSISTKRAVVNGGGRRPNTVVVPHEAGLCWLN